MVALHGQSLESCLLLPVEVTSLLALTQSTSSSTSRCWATPRRACLARRPPPRWRTPCLRRFFR